MFQRLGYEVTQSLTALVPSSIATLTFMLRFSPMSLRAGTREAGVMSAINTADSLIFFLMVAASGGLPVTPRYFQCRNVPLDKRRREPRRKPLSAWAIAAE
jgi:hypothetical protein